MDGNAPQRSLHQDRHHLQPDPRMRLERLRKNLIRAAAEGPGRARTLRVILYTLTTSQREPATDFTRLRAYAGDAFHIKREVHDRASRPDRAPAPQHRNGWLAACLLMRQGAADGVIALCRHVISPDDALYESELLWIGDHFAFLDLIIPESR